MIPVIEVETVVPSPVPLDCSDQIEAAVAPLRDQIATLTARLEEVKRKAQAFASDISND